VPEAEVVNEPAPEVSTWPEAYPDAWPGNPVYEEPPAPASFVLPPDADMWADDVPEPESLTRAPLEFAPVDSAPTEVPESSPTIGFEPVDMAIGQPPQLEEISLEEDSFTPLVETETSPAPPG